jgi:two-component system, response regulator
MSNNLKEKTVLLVEDNADDVFLTKRALANMDVAHRLVVAKDGVEALAYLSKHCSNNKSSGNGIPVVVLLDLKLPKIDGLEVLKEIRSNENTCLLPVLIVTSSDEKGDIINANQLGATSYNVKPIDSAKYIEMIQRLISPYFN